MLYKDAHNVLDKDVNYNALVKDAKFNVLANDGNYNSLAKDANCNFLAMDVKHNFLAKDANYNVLAKDTNCIVLAKKDAKADVRQSVMNTKFYRHAVYTRSSLKAQFSYLTYWKSSPVLPSHTDAQPLLFIYETVDFARRP
jgi:hypothetical protein